MRLSTEDYVARIANASQLQLVIINYEIIIDYIKAAEKSAEENNKEDFNLAVEKSRAFLSELRNSLNMKYEISRNLMSLYNYVDRQLAYYTFNKKTKYSQECIKILSELLEGWKEIENNEEDKSPLMQNTQQLYAGLTYGRGGKLQEYVDVDNKRGFKA